MYEQLGLFDSGKTCSQCKFLIKDYYIEKVKTFDYCTKKKMYIDNCLTIKEKLCKLGK